MDILTQGLLGGVVAQSIAERDEKKRATLIGIFSGLLADADILISSANDPLLNIEYHRHFTHSLFFVPFGAAVACLLLWPFLRRQLPLSRLYLFCLAGFGLSGVLDALTSYGTLLFWPFSDQRVAWNAISIVDPVFTLILLVSLVLGWRLASRRAALSGLVLCGLYLGLGFIQQHRALQMADELIAKRNHQPLQQVVKPTLGNLLLWRSVYTDSDRIYVDALRVGLFERTIYPGESVHRFDLSRDLPSLDPDSTLAQDIRRFERFSDGYVAIEPEQPGVLGDIRYSMLPQSTKPLWGISIDPQNPKEHAEYHFYRDNSQGIRRTFLNMLLGRCAAADCAP
jgi:inner membrane protein